MLGLKKKLILYGFNNLTKTLSISGNGVCYEKSKRMLLDDDSFNDLHHSSMRLQSISGNVLNLVLRLVEKKNHLFYADHRVLSTNQTTLFINEGVEIFKNKTSFPIREAIK